MIVGWIPVPSPPRRVGVRVPVMLVPGWGHIARIRFEKQSRHGEHALTRVFANWTGRRITGGGHWSLFFEECSARRAVEIVAWHPSR